MKLISRELMSITIMLDRSDCYEDEDLCFLCTCMGLAEYSNCRNPDQY